MGKIIKKSLLIVVVLSLMSGTILYSQDIKVNAGEPQIINWEVTHTAQFEGSVSPSKIKVEWSCPQNSQVVFKDASNPVTEVTFPRPGYYLLVLSAKVKGKESPSSSVIVNVFQPNSYEERLSDLIGLMTVDEKIRQLTNQSDPIPRLGVPR